MARRLCVMVVHGRERHVLVLLREGVAAAFHEVRVTGRIEGCNEKERLCYDAVAASGGACMPALLESEGCERRDGIA